MLSSALPALFNGWRETIIAGDGSYSPIGSTPTGVLSYVPVKSRESSVD